VSGVVACSGAAEV
jgi:hypothetical protein